MQLPYNVSLVPQGDYAVEVRGWASEPFVMTAVSALKSLERVRSRRSSYDTPSDYERHLSVYVEAMRMMGWEIPDDPDAVAEPVPPETPQVAPQVTPQVAPQVEPAEPAVPAVPAEPTGHIPVETTSTSTRESWADRIPEDEQFDLELLE